MGRKPVVAEERRHCARLRQRVPRDSVEVGGGHPGRDRTLDSGVNDGDNLPGLVHATDLVFILDRHRHGTASYRTRAAGSAILLWIAATIDSVTSSMGRLPSTRSTSPCAS